MRTFISFLCAGCILLGTRTVATAQKIPVTAEWDGTDFTVSWRTTPPLEFDLQSTTSLLPGTWLPLPPAAYTVVVDGDLTRVTHPSPMAPRRFYRGALQPGHPLCTDLCLVRKINLREAMDRDLDTNVLKIFEAVADPATNRLYVSGILTEDMGVLNTSTQTWEDNLSTGDTGLKYLWADTTNRYLFSANATNGKVSVLDLDTWAPVVSKELTEVPADRRSGVFRRVGIDTNRGRIIVPMPDPSPPPMPEPFLRAYDSSTLEEDTDFTTNLTVANIGLPFFDPLEDVVYAFDNRSTGTSRNIYRLHPADGHTLATIAFTAPAGELVRFAERNPAAEEFYILTREEVPLPASQTLLILDATGGILGSTSVTSTREITEMIVDPAGAWIALFSVKSPSGGMVEGVEGRLEVYDTATMTLDSSTPFGLKPTSIAYDAASGRIYSPNGDASTVWSFDSPFTTATALPLGDSLEQVVPFEGTGRVFMNSRLGGSYLMESDVTKYTDTPFVSGTWPIPLRVDSSNDRLYVLNAWDSKLAIYDLTPTRSLAAAVSLGLPPGSTDRLPDMVVDGANHLAHVAYPEFGSMVTVNTTSETVVATRPIPDITPGSTPAGPGQVNLGVNEDLELVYALIAETRNLVVYRPSPLMPLENDLSAEDWGSAFDKFSTDLLFRDETNDRLFAGPVELDPATGASLGRLAIGRGDRVFAYDSILDSYWTIGWELPPGGGVGGYFIAVLDRATLALQHKKPIPDQDGFSPHVAFDTGQRLLYVGYFIEAELHIYAAPRSLPFGP